MNKKCYREKKNKYKYMRKILVLFGVIFFITSILAKSKNTIMILKDTNKNTKVDEIKYKQKYNSEFNNTYLKIYDGLISINEVMVTYAKEIDKAEDKSIKAIEVLKDQQKIINNSEETKNIESMKITIDRAMKELKNSQCVDDKYYLLEKFYNSYCDYYKAFKHVNGSCNEYITNVKNIEYSAIDLGDRINKLK